MTPLFNHWKEVSEKIRKASRRLLLFDFDGTLVPIRAHPELVRLRRQTRQWLSRLSQAPGTEVGLISGRELLDLQQRVGVEGLIYVGNHGFEILRDGNLFTHPAANTKRGLLQCLAGEIEASLKKVPGAWVEDKGCTLTVHFRQVLSNRIPEVKRIVQDIVRLRTVPGGLHLKEGKKVIEVRPEKKWHKGSAVELLRRRTPLETLVLYVGDDKTDEDVFKALARRDISIRVGRCMNSRASYYVQSPVECQRLLKKLAKLLAEGGNHA